MQPDKAAATPANPMLQGDLNDGIRERANRGNTTSQRKYEIEVQRKKDHTSHNVRQVRWQVEMYFHVSGQVSTQKYSIDGKDSSDQKAPHHRVFRNVLQTDEKV